MTRILWLLLFVVVWLIPSPSEAHDDVGDIVDAHFSSLQVDAKLDEGWRQFMGSLATALADLGGTVIDETQFRKELLGDFETEVLVDIRTHWISVYQSILTPDEIRDLAAFYRSPQGQDWLASDAVEVALLDRENPQIPGPVSPLLDHWQDIDTAGEIIEPQMNARMLQLFSYARFADVLDMPTVVQFDDETTREAVVKELRASK